MKRFGCLIAIAAAIPISARPSFADDSIPGTTTIPCGLRYSTDELLERVDLVFGEGRGNEIRDLLEDPEDPVGLIEIGHAYGNENAIGDHDHDTVGLDTQTLGCDLQLTLTEAAIVLSHEMDHVASARAADEAFDPATRGACGACEHAGRHWREICDALALCGLWSDLPPELHEEICRALGGAILAAEHWTAQCDLKCPSDSYKYAADKHCVEQLFAACCPL